VIEANIESSMDLVLFDDLQLIKTSVQFNGNLQKLFSSGFFKLKTHYKR